MQTLKTTTNNINSWCQKVLDLLDITFADCFELHGTFGKFQLFPWFMNISPTLQLTFGKFPLFLQTREEIGGQLMKLEDIWNIPDISRIYPSHANSETKKV